MRPTVHAYNSQKAYVIPLSTQPISSELLCAIASTGATLNGEESGESVPGILSYEIPLVSHCSARYSRFLKLASRESTARAVQRRPGAFHYTANCVRSKSRTVGSLLICDLGQIPRDKTSLIPLVDLGDPSRPSHASFGTFKRKIAEEAPEDGPRCSV